MKELLKYEKDPVVFTIPSLRDITTSVGDWILKNNPPVSTNFQVLKSNLRPIEYPTKIGASIAKTKSDVMNKNLLVFMVIVE
jgi:hypothetical protein